MNALALRGHSLLLVEPQFLLRRTVAAVARDLGLADVHEVSNLERAADMLREQSVHGLVIAWDGGGTALALIEAVRAGQTACPPDLPVVVLAERCDAELAQTLKRLQVRRLLLKPFTVKGVLTSIDTLWPVWASDAGQTASRVPA